MTFTRQYLEEAAQILDRIDRDAVEKAVDLLALLRSQEGRLFVLGVGGSAATASHVVNDFRKIAELETYAPTDNVSELTARVNDDGWDTVFSSWLQGSRLGPRDGILVFSVGGGDLQRNVSPNLVKALQLAKERGALVIGIVGRDGGFTAQVADACILVPIVNPENITPHTESFHSLLGHLLVSHPKLKAHRTKWESISQ